MVGKYGRPHDGDMSRGYFAGTSPWDIMRDTAQTYVVEYLPRICRRMSRGYIAEHDPEICSGTRCRDMICA